MKEYDFGLSWSEKINLLYKHLNFRSDLMNRLKVTGINSFILSIVIFSSFSWAQHFTFTDLTGNNMTVVVPTSIAPTIDGSPIEIGDEIGVFTPADLCVGAATWTGSNIAITVWGDDDQTPAIDGMVAGEALNFKIWDL